MNNRFPKSERLSSTKSIDALFGENEAFLAYPLRCVFRRVEGETSLALLVSVPKRRHRHAVVRNLLKRRIREAYRLNRTYFEGVALEFSLTYISSEVLPYPNIESAVKKVFAELGNRLAGGVG